MSNTWVVHGPGVGTRGITWGQMISTDVGDADYGMRITYVTDEDGTSLVCSEI